MSQVSSLESVTPALSIQLINFAAKDPGPGGWQPLLDQARAADMAGIDRLVVSDHVILGERLDEYGKPEVGGTQGGQQPTGPDGQWLEPLTLLSVVAGITSHSRLLTGILIAALRRPVVLAKSAATLDVLSQGRLDLGVGVGWQREEYEAAGMQFEGRGRLLDHTLEVCQALWRNPSANYDSDLLQFEKIHCHPQPLQEGGVPFWVSGRLNANVLRRIGRFGSGWIPWGDDALDPSAGMTRVREALDQAGRSAEGFQVTAALPTVKGDSGIDFERTMERVPPMVEAGITDFRAYLPIPEDPSAAHDYLAQAVATFRKATNRAT
jgi:probable F420-dependent oxidoreductase